jgi:hypothetical protein
VRVCVCVCVCSCVYIDIYVCVQACACGVVTEVLQVQELKLRRLSSPCYSAVETFQCVSVSVSVSERVCVCLFECGSVSSVRCGTSRPWTLQHV